MATVGECVRRKQPAVYALLEVWRHVEAVARVDGETEDSEAAFREIERLMRGRRYVRGRGGVLRQVRGA